MHQAILKPLCLTLLVICLLGSSQAVFAQSFNSKYHFYLFEVTQAEMNEINVIETEVLPATYLYNFVDSSVVLNSLKSKLKEGNYLVLSYMNNPNSVTYNYDKLYHFQGSNFSVESIMLSPYQSVVIQNRQRVYLFITNNENEPVSNAFVSVNGKEVNYSSKVMGYYLGKRKKTYGIVSVKYQDYQYCTRIIQFDKAVPGDEQGLRVLECALIAVLDLIGAILTN